VLYQPTYLDRQSHWPPAL